MKNIEEMREEISDVITKLKNKQLDAKTAGAFSNLFARVTASLKVQVDHAKACGEKPKIKFLKESDKKR